jgi:uncharacterized membrane protein
MIGELRFEIMLGLLAMFAVGFADLTRRRGLMVGANPFAFFLIESLFQVGFVLAAAFLLQGGLKFTGATLTYAPISGFLIFVGIVSLLVALQSAEANRIVPIARLGLVVTFVFATLLLGERLTISRVLGVALAAGAVVLLSLDF